MHWSCVTVLSMPIRESLSIIQLNSSAVSRDPWSLSASTDRLDPSRRSPSISSETSSTISRYSTASCCCRRLQRAAGNNFEQLNSQVVDLFSQYNLHQHVSLPTHVSGNVLDLILSQASDVTTDQPIGLCSICAVSLHADLSPWSAADATCCGDVQLRSLRRMDTAAFRHATIFSDRNCFRPV